MPRSGIIAWLLCLVAACGRPPIESPHGRTGHGPLGNVVLLPLTTRTTEGLLGHALHADGVTPNRGECVMQGPTTVVPTSQDVTVVRELAAEDSVSASYGPLAAKVRSGELTHLAYEVRITGYAELRHDTSYRAESDCCFNGVAQARCAAGFVDRLVRGTGRIVYLAQSEHGAAASAAGVFEASTGERYRVLDEYAFEDAFFGFERGHTATLCRSLPDVATFDPVEVAPTPNCSVMAYQVSGDSEHLAKYLPDEVTCREVGLHFCKQHNGCVRCLGSFGDGDDRRVFTLAVTKEQPAGAVPAPAPAVPVPAVPADASTAPAGAAAAARPAESLPTPKADGVAPVQ